MWIKVKRVLLLIIGAIVLVLGAGTTISALLGYYGAKLGMIAMGILMGILLSVLGAFFIYLGVRGTDKQVADTDLL